MPMAPLNFHHMGAYAMPGMPGLPIMQPIAMPGMQCVTMMPGAMMAHPSWGAGP